MKFETNDHEYMVFKMETEYNGKKIVNYSIGISKKMQDGSYDNAYIPCQFRKDTIIDNKTKIKIKDAWLTFYKTKKDDKTQTIPYVFINEFEKNDVIEATKNMKDPYQQIGEEIQLTDADLPF